MEYNRTDLRVTSDVWPICDACVGLWPFDARIVEKRESITSTTWLCVVAGTGSTAVGFCNLGSTSSKGRATIFILLEFRSYIGNTKRSLTAFTKIFGACIRVALVRAIGDAGLSCHLVASGTVSVDRTADVPNGGMRLNHSVLYC